MPVDTRPTLPVGILPSVPTQVQPIIPTEVLPIVPTEVFPTTQTQVPVSPTIPVSVITPDLVPLPPLDLLRGGFSFETPGKGKGKVKGRRTRDLISSTFDIQIKENKRLAKQIEKTGLGFRF